MMLARSHCRQVREALLKNIKRRMTPQPLKIRADVELTCFAYDGVERIRDAMRAAQALSTEDCPVKMKLVAPPLYVLTTQTLDKAKGVEVRAACVQAVGWVWWGAWRVAGGACQAEGDVRVCGCDASRQQSPAVSTQPSRHAP
jgi:translation initiation factor 2 alpha subunit (eIF-2alpha)